MSGSDTTAATLTLASDGEGEGGHASAAAGVWLVASPDPLYRERDIPLSEGLTLGRRDGEGVTTVIADAGMSRRHAEIERWDDGWRVVDQGSKNGLFCNGVRVQRADLSHGDVLRLGETVGVFYARKAAEPLDVQTHGFIGRSAELEETVARLDRAALSSANVLVVGETGTGKELAARRLHERSGRTGDWVAVNCAAIAPQLAEAALFGHRRGAFTGATESGPGYFGRAEGGTIFLDEVGELPLELQPKLLRTLEAKTMIPVGETRERPVDVRVISATHLPLEDAVSRGDFRADLYARIAGLTVSIPPLRGRRLDIPLLLRHFLRGEGEGESQLYRWSAEFTEALLLHPWVLNVRGLRNLAHQIRAELKPESLVTAAWVPLSPEDRAATESTDEPGREQLVQSLVEAQGNVAKVAREFGKARRQVYRWLERLDIDPASFR